MASPITPTFENVNLENNNVPSPITNANLNDNNGLASESTGPSPLVPHNLEDNNDINNNIDMNTNDNNNDNHNIHQQNNDINDTNNIDMQQQQPALNAPTPLSNNNDDNDNNNVNNNNNTETINNTETVHVAPTQDSRPPSSGQPLPLPVTPAMGLHTSGTSGMGLHVPTPANLGIETPTPKTKRKFQEAWRDRFPWVLHNPETNMITCTACRDAGKKNMFAKGEYGKNGMKKDDIAKHAGSRDHLSATDCYPEMPIKRKAGKKKNLEVEREEQRQMEKISLFNKDVIKLNVGGQYFTTNKLTMQKYPGLLCTMFSGKYPLPVEIDGHYFINRDGTYFRYILDFLRGSRYAPAARPGLDFQNIINNLLSHDERKELAKEAHFYNLLEYMFPYFDSETRISDFLRKSLLKKNIDHIEKAVSYCGEVALELTIQNEKQDKVLEKIKPIFDGIYSISSIDATTGNCEWSKVIPIDAKTDFKSKKKAPRKRKNKKAKVDETEGVGTGSATEVIPNTNALLDILTPTEMFGNEITPSLPSQPDFLIVADTYKDSATRLSYNQETQTFQLCIIEDGTPSSSLASAAAVTPNKPPPPIIMSGPMNNDLPTNVSSWMRKVFGEIDELCDIQCQAICSLDLKTILEARKMLKILRN